MIHSLDLPPKWPLRVLGARFWFIGAGAIVPVAATLSVAAPGVLVNTTPSEPMGLYARVNLAPQAGRLVAFHAPPAAFPYADGRLAYLHQVPLLKTIAAGPGDRVCTTSGVLTINGRPRGVIAERDREGRALPHWRGCRAMADGELFTLADRVPNSFDSRYFGPIPARSVIGVFRPLLTMKDGN
ncbi:MAG TPA: S26 family signal peptidase [Caulobacteraceae bacterium]|nr:S26 family signal peptidase [Caulobacteraceae bacterium]